MKKQLSVFALHARAAIGRLALVLLAGCAAALYSLITGRRSCRAWMIFGAVTLSALCWV